MNPKKEIYLTSTSACMNRMWRKIEIRNGELGALKNLQIKEDFLLILLLLTMKFPELLDMIWFGYCYLLRVSESTKWTRNLNKHVRTNWNNASYDFVWIHIVTYYGIQCILPFRSTNRRSQKLLSYRIFSMGIACPVSAQITNSSHLDNSLIHFNIYQNSTKP